MASASAVYRGPAHTCRTADAVRASRSGSGSVRSSAAAAARRADSVAKACSRSTWSGPPASSSSASSIAVGVSAQLTAAVAVGVVDPVGPALASNAVRPSLRGPIHTVTQPAPLWVCRSPPWRRWRRSTAFVHSSTDIARTVGSAMRAVRSWRRSAVCSSDQATCPSACRRSRTP